MLYMEDFLELIEPFPQEIRERLTEMREIDLQIQNESDKLDQRVDLFFQQCKKQKPETRTENFENFKKEYAKLLENADDKIQIATQLDELIDRYLKKLDQEIHKFKLELEADHAGITSKLEEAVSKSNFKETNSAAIQHSCPSATVAAATAAALSVSSSPSLHKLQQRSSMDFAAAAESDFFLTANNNSTSNYSHRKLSGGEGACLVPPYTNDFSTTFFPPPLPPPPLPLSSQSTTTTTTAAHHHHKRKSEKLSLGGGAESTNNIGKEESEANTNATTWSNKKIKSYATNQKLSTGSVAGDTNRFLFSMNKLNKMKTEQTKSSLPAMASTSGGGGGGGESFTIDDVFTDESVPKDMSHFMEHSFGTTNKKSGMLNSNSSYYPQQDSDQSMDENAATAAGAGSTIATDYEENETLSSSDYETTTSISQDSTSKTKQHTTNTKQARHKSFKDDWNSGEDTSEKYCICKDVSYGEMIMCDNARCGTQWFHFTCVGLSSAPKGKWFCQACSEIKRKIRLQSEMAASMSNVSAAASTAITSTSGAGGSATTPAAAAAASSDLSIQHQQNSLTQSQTTLGFQSNLKKNN